MNKVIFLFLMLFILPNTSFGNNCKIDIEANGMMQFSTDTITIDSGCKKFDINLLNTGQLDVNLAGHNIVISKKSDFDYLTSIVNPSEGIDSGYLPKDNKVLYKTKFLGPNESITLSVNPSKFTKGENYMFWCSFLGHWGVMNGSVVLK